MTRSRKPGRHRVNLVNNGNAPTVAQVALTDRDGELTYDRTEFGANLVNGATEAADFLVNGPWRWFGRTQTYPFTATVTAKGTPRRFCSTAPASRCRASRGGYQPPRWP